MKVFVLGTGGWGIALAMLLHQNGHEVTSWTYQQAECDLLHRERCNEKLLPGVIIPDGIEITTDMAGAKDAELVVLAVPSFAVASTAEKLASIVKPGTVLVNVGKGLDSKNGYCRFSETITRAVDGRNPVVALTGPTHAEEVARGIPTAIVAASESRAAAELTQEAFMNETNFRVYTSSDIIGCELGGAFKNIIALGAGISDGLGLGDNSKAAFMTRGLTEIARLGVKLGAKQETFAGLSGVGDLIVTCCSMHSRNRRAGILIGKGATAQEAMAEVGATVEGYYATEAGYHLAKQQGVSMPITEAMYGVLYGGMSAQDGIKLLLGRPTLSATPIPRTLNMAMSGIRDLSTIEQPPIERQPVETFVLEYNDVILAEAMKKELARGGQVYYLHNRVDNIESCAAHVSQMVPGARVGIAHGKMTEEELNPVWQHLLNGEIDILVCTTLIETGIDVRNCNTLSEIRNVAFSPPPVMERKWF